MMNKLLPLVFEQTAAYEPAPKKC